MGKFKTVMWKYDPLRVAFRQTCCKTKQIYTINSYFDGREKKTGGDNKVERT